MAEQTWRTPEAVRTWLEQQPEGAVVGNKRNPDSCTLAQCYLALTGIKVRVEPKEIWVQDQPGKRWSFHRSKPWEKRFIKRHDTRMSTPNMSRERALFILNAVDPVPS